jgi:hypothetical protein
MYFFSNLDASIYQTIKYKGDELGTITGVDNALIFGPTITYYLSGIYLIVISIINRFYLSGIKMMLRFMDISTF